MFKKNQDSQLIVYFCGNLHVLINFMIVYNFFLSFVRQKKKNQNY